MRVSGFVMALILVVSLFAAGPGGAAAPDDLVLVEVVSGLVSPVAVRNAGDGSGRIFILEKAGFVRIFDGEELLPLPFLDISSAVTSSGSEQGLLGLAFDPDYTNNGYFYVNYTMTPASGPDRTRVARYQVSAGNPNVADPTEFVLIEIAQDFSNHNGGDIHFGPDGYLYIGMGDGGSGGDPNDRAQDLQQLLGKMLRIDVHAPPSEGGLGVVTTCGLVVNYGVPVDNPFVGDGNACDEIWAFGVRNPWRFSFDRLTGDLVIGDVGQNAWEEVDFQEASSTGGENYGWRCYEGTHPYNTTDCAGPYVDPVVEYAHASGRCSITGGFVYRGHGIAGFDGTYTFADYCTGDIWFASPDDSWSVELWQDTPLGVVSFGEDEAGELYVADLFGGKVYRFESPSSIFADGFESGDAAAW